ncbi:hypothetical protein H5410_036619 [Solanum commersonii]|uniref:Uncharacterized protein n=1 Tax=Solanum commersonii TaxID=4109 RepID=A0A9J5Y420_SOLCO|nr:hypothetical protein H5410_036619 [Solanum commersonii]
MQVVRVNEKAELDDTKLSSATKIVVSKILKYGYQSKTRFGPKSSKLMFVLEQTPIPYQVVDDDIVEGMENLSVAIVGEEEEINLSKLIICNVEPRDVLQNWTISLFLFRQESW